MSTYGEFRVGTNYECGPCSKFSDTYPAGLDKFNVLTEEQYMASIHRINEAYAPTTANCISYAFCLVPILGCICMSVSKKSRTRRLLQAIALENQQFTSDKKPLPVQFTWITTSITTTIRTNRRGRTRASSRANKSLVLRVGVQSVPVIVVGGQTIINNHTTIIQGDGNTFNGATTNTNMSSSRMAQVAVDTSPVHQTMGPVDANQNAPGPAEVPSNNNAPPAYQQGQTMA